MREINVASKSVKGRRPANEDACLVLTSGDLDGWADGFYAVADGMGGRASGATASKMTVNALSDFYASPNLASLSPSEALSRSLRSANEAVCREAASKPELNGMGTTCVALLVKDEKAFYAHMGDSRAYLLRGGEITRLTDDHSFVAEKVKSGEITEEQARTSRFRNVITRAVGLDPDAQPELGSTDIRFGDVLLLCSDGLTGPVTDAQIADILSISADVDEACDELVKAALRNGGSDNITVVVAACSPARRTAVHTTAPAARKPVGWVVPALIGLLVGIALGGLGDRYVLPEILKDSVVQEEPITPTPSIREYENPISLLDTSVQSRLLSLDGRGYLHVADREGRLMRVDSAGRVIYPFPAQESLKPTSGVIPRVAASDREGNLYLSDPAGKCIAKYGRDGLFLHTIGEGALPGVSAMVIGEDGSIYVIDSGILRAIRPKPPVEDVYERNTP